MYKIQFTKEALRNLKDLDKKYQKAVAKAIDKLSVHPQVGKPLIGSLKGLWKLRFSRYRIIYQIFDQRLLVIVLEVTHRKDVYRRQ